MFGSMFGNYLNNRNYVDEDGKSVILYEKSLLSLPMMISGAIFGLMVNQITPGIILVIGLVAFLVHSIRKIHKNYLTAKEKEEMQARGNLTDNLLNKVEVYPYLQMNFILSQIQIIFINHKIGKQRITSCPYTN